MKINTGPAFTFTSDEEDEYEVFRPSVGDIQKLGKAFPDGFENVVPEEFGRQLLRISAFPIGMVSDGKKPDQPILDEEQIKKFSQTDLECFAEKYLNRIGTVIGNPIDTEDRKPGETAVQFMHRTSAKQYEDFAKQMRAISSKATLGLKDHFAKSLAFSETTRNSILRTVDLAKQLQQSIAIPKADHFRTPMINPQELADLHEENRLRPFRLLETKLEELINANAESADFLMQMNASQTLIAEELQNSGKQNASFSKWNLTLAAIVLFLTATSVSITGIGLWQSSRNNRAASVLNQKQVDQISGKLDSLKISISRSMRNSTKFDSLSMEEIRHLSAANRALTEYLKRQSKTSPKSKAKPIDQRSE